MNIIVNTHNGYICRPDTTWERENKDFYSPDLIKDISFTPILFARISKAGKCISRKFASRYYDAVSYGMLMYAENLISENAGGYATASMLDHTSILPYPLYDKCVLENGTNEYTITRNGDELFRTSAGSAEIIEDAITKASELISLRIGDHIAIELAEREILSKYTSDSESTSVSGTFCDNRLFEFRIIR